MATLTAVVPDNAGPGHGESFVWNQGPGHPPHGIVAVDAGGTRTVGARAGTMAPTILVLSHDDHDHIGGAVALIQTAKDSLEELWVPVEWALLIKQISETGTGEQTWDDEQGLTLSDLEESIRVQLSDAPRHDGETVVESILVGARAALATWTASPSDQSFFTLIAQPGDGNNFYGAATLDEIIDRVKHRAGAIIDILEAATDESLHIRFFSIDLALVQNVDAWSTEGRPGAATIANAAETTGWTGVTIPPGLANAFMLTRLTVQNRRALCTYLWAESTAGDDDAIIWSDTDGQWLNHLSALGIGARIDQISLSSAPHHASGNHAHFRVWAELARRTPELRMICAGGQYNQAYHPDYVALGDRRCCTRCRPNNPQYREVVAARAPGGGWTLNQVCRIHH